MKCDASLKNRIKRTQGQMRGVLNMMENESACVDILPQLKAIRSSIDKTIAMVTTQNLIQTIERDLDVTLDNIQDAVSLIIKGK
jgi:DNA-binding FrmR family transcriptional regulator